MPYRKLLLSAVIVCVLTPGVSAQENEVDPTEAPTRLEEIVVIGKQDPGQKHNGFPRACRPHQTGRHA